MYYYDPAYCHTPYAHSYMPWTCGMLVHHSSYLPR